MSVHSIRDGVEIRQPGAPVPDLIKELERVLELARSGEVSGAAIALSWRDECTSWLVSGQRVLKARLVQEKLDQ